jgi:hypothetical protein
MSLDLPVVLLHWHVEDGSHWSVKMAIQFAWHFSAVFWRGESDAIWLEAQILQVWPSVAFRLDQMQEAAVKIQRAVWTYQLRKLNGGVGWSFKPASVVTSRPANDSTQPARFRSELRWQTMFRYYLISDANIVWFIQICVCFVLFSDHDECGETGMCAHGICINMDGSFKWQCQEGYALSPSGHSCVGM